MATIMATKVTHHIPLWKLPKCAAYRYQGCINYNPVLAHRQFGYSIKGSPTFDALTTLLISYKDGGATEVLCDIRNAWRNVIRMKRDSRAWAVNREIPYRTNLQLLNKRRTNAE